MFSESKQALNDTLLALSMMQLVLLACDVVSSSQSWDSSLMVSLVWWIVAPLGNLCLIGLLELDLNPLRVYCFRLKFVFLFLGL